MWTLVGMGVTAVLALLMTVLAYLAQSPRALLRLGLGGQRLDLRVKLFTGYALASLILMLGFFLAGVPLDNETRTTAVSPTVPETANSDSTQSDSGAMIEPETAVPSSNAASANNLAEAGTQTPASGAFGGPPPSSSNQTVTDTAPLIATPEQAGPSSTPNSDNEETAVPTNSVSNNSGTATATTTPSPTATPLPTATPTATITPTPIEGETATIDTNGSTLWVRRSPGGQQLVLVQDKELVILENGRANQGGILWRKIRTVTGILGWVQEDFLDDG